jgi:hypothetical protein
MELWRVGENPVVRSAELVCFEIFPVGGVAAGEDMASIGKAHLLEGVEENLFLAWGVARSGARFMPISRASTVPPSPSQDKAWPMTWSFDGRRIQLFS